MSRRPIPALLAAVALAALLACKGEPTGDELIAAKADQTLRQLLAGMNAKNLPVMQKLLVITSTTGGRPRPLTDAEMRSVVFPHPPYSYAGPGAPGYMTVKDGQGTRHAVHMVVLDEALKVVARREKLAEASDVRVITFLEAPAPAKKK